MRNVAPIIVAIVLFVVLAVIFAWMWSRPSWQLSAHNSPQGVIIEIYKSNAAQPTYSTVLTGQTIDTEVDRASRMELPLEVGRTTFYDETLRPGRWKVVVNETEIDIMERALIVNGTAETALEPTSRNKP